LFVYQDRKLRNLPCKRVQLDEIWCFVYSKQSNVKRAKSAPANAGDAWTWTAICADTKLLVTTLVGQRNMDYALMFVDDLRSRLANRVQITSDGLAIYLPAMDTAFGEDADYAMLQKIYEAGPEGQRRYSPARCVGARKREITGNPDPSHISTSYVERQNLTMRMHMRRFTRLTNAFSKKLENHAYAVALHQMFYNFVRIHQTLRVTPAMAAGLTDRLWEIGDIVGVIEAWEAEQATAGITYEIGENRIGGGYYVTVLPRYEPAGEPIYGFDTRAAAEAWAEADRAKHRPGRRPKLLELN
jgi:transposase-like protein